jgi:hypothetical protein
MDPEPETGIKSKSQALGARERHQEPEIGNKRQRQAPKARGRHQD